MSFLDYFRRTRCRKMTVPMKVCYLKFKPDKPCDHKNIGETNRGETVVVDYNQKGEIIGIELAGGGKPCCENAMSWAEFEMKLSKHRTGRFRLED